MEGRHPAPMPEHSDAHDDGLGPLDLLASTRRLRGAAVEADLTTIHSELAALRNRLLDRLHARSAELAHLPGAAPEVVRSGQQRILRLVDELLFAADHGGTDCTCLLRSAEVDVALRRQARLEGALLGLRARLGRDGDTGIMGDQPTAGEPDERAGDGRPAGAVDR